VCLKKSNSGLARIASHCPAYHSVKGESYI